MEAAIRVISRTECIGSGWVKIYKIEMEKKLSQFSSKVGKNEFKRKSRKNIQKRKNR